MEAKPVRESASEYSELTLPNDSNGFGNVLGGKVMHLVDLAGAMAGAMLIDCQQKGPTADGAVDDQPKRPGIAGLVTVCPPLYAHRACDARKRGRLRVASTRP